MSPPALRAVAAVVAANIGLFLAVVVHPAFQAAHHHWIFPVLALGLAAQWALSFLPLVPARLADRAAARSAVLSVLLFVLLIGVVRHATILACFDRCAFKLAAAAAAAGLAFLLQAAVRDGGFWRPARAGLAAIAGLLWALYLALRALNLTPWIIDGVFLILALLLWLGRDRPSFLIASIGVVAALGVRATANEYAIISLGVLLAGLALAAVPAAEARLSRRAARPAPQPPLGRRLLLGALRVGLAVGVIVGLVLFVAGPISYMTDPAKRRAHLLANAQPAPGNRSLSPLAASLRAHVVMLAETIGERDASRRGKQERARDYVAARLRALGYEVKLIPYEALWMASVPNGTKFWNVEAVLRVRNPEPGAWILGAHYDSAPGTPGADDDASGVAVLLEAARLLKARPPRREVRFVAFGTEEPPSFGTRNMGSAHYARRLKDGGVAVHGMISLEMLGFYNTRPGSQLYPPFLHLFFPRDGAFVGAVADVRSRPLLASFGAAWKANSKFPLVSAALPGPFSSLALSDQLNFWALGWPAIMLSDTAFYRNPHYHEATDLPATLDYERMAEVTRALTAAVEGAR